jgi:hypothetical protein
MNKKDCLAQVKFGSQVAEDEGDDLASYFVATDNWNRIYSGDIDVIYGPKGSGKSALYSLLTTKIDDLLERQIILLTAENPRGTPAFYELNADPPVSEPEFVGLWKLYFLTLIGASFEEHGFVGENAQALIDALAREGLTKGRRSLKAVVQASFDYVKKVTRTQEIGGGVEIDPVTQLPKGFNGKIVFREPTGEARKLGALSIDHLLTVADEALLENSNFTVWILLDRLDVAFLDNVELERNALRALFRVYLDLLNFKNIELKIFLRTDIWKSITEGGFREASHITRQVTISWDTATLLNLIVRRALHNPSLIEYYQVAVDDVLQTIEAQKLFFYRMFPTQVEVGEKSPRPLNGC